MHSRFVPFGLVLATLTALADQMAKLGIQKFVFAPPAPFRPVPVTPFLNFVFSWNKGVTFGLFNHRHVTWISEFFLGVAGVALVLLFVWLWRAQTRLTAWGLGLVMGGAAGNAVDRYRHGAVFDFLDVHMNTYHWFAFNLADSAIVMGVALLLLESWTSRQRS